MSDEKSPIDNTAGVDSKKKVDTVAVDDAHKTEKVTKLGREDMDPDDESE